MAAKTMTGLPGTLLPAEAPQPKKDPADQPLPPLREDLVLHAGPSGRDGAPTWVIEDPARDRFFQIGRFEAEVLRRWGLGTARAILSPGEWVSEGEKLAVIAEGHLEAVGYLSERDLGRIEPGASARFVAENGLEAPLKLVVTDIAATATRHLGEVPELASPMGGGIAARDAPPDILKTVDERDRSAGRVWVPDEALYQVKLAPGDDAAEISAEAVLRGTVVIEGRPESLLGRFLSYGFSVLLRESGF